MNPDSQNRSNYLVAFLAAIIGLAAFKDTLSEYIFTLFKNNFTWLSAVMPLIIVLLLAAYLGALSYFSQSITFTKAPLNKYLNIASNTVAILALLYPIALLLMLGISWLLAQVEGKPNVLETIYLVTTTIVSILSLVMALIVARNFYSIRVDFQKQAVLDSFDNAIKNNISEPEDSSLTHRFLYEYEHLQRLMTRYLQFKGYGIEHHTSVLRLAQILRSKKVFNDQDVDKAGYLNKHRNLYAHGAIDISEKELKTATKNVRQLQDKIKAALIT